MKECLVIMPIGSGQVYDKFRSRYDHIIKPAVEGLEVNDEQVFRCVRSDEVAESGSITRDLLNRLYRSQVVIADITDMNPNVFYELGVRHALRPGTILIAEKGTRPPFNVSHERVVLYEDRAGREAQSIAAIQTVLRPLAGNHNIQDSPVLDAIPEAAKAALPSVPFLDRPNWKRLENGTIQSPLDGRWLEILDRFEKGQRARHYSLFNFQYDAASHVHPFSMTGDSFHSGGEPHSHWETRYLRIELSGKTWSVEYIYSAVIRGGESRRGYGISRFWPNAAGALATGSGHYLAGEEKDPYCCYYRLERIGEDRLERYRTAKELVIHLDGEYGSVSTGSDS